MRILKSIVLLILTNLAVLFVLNVAVNLLGLDVMWMTKTGIDVKALFVGSAIMGFAGAFISLAMSRVIAKWSTGAKVIDQPRTESEAWLVSTVERLARQSGIKTPEVAIYDSPDVNAFATGPTRNRSLVAVSTGLLDNMHREEVEAVLAHEVAHAANGDMVTMTLLQGVLNTFVIALSRVIGYAVDQALRGNREGGPGMGYYVTNIAAQIVLGVLASLIVAAFSRRREYRADAGAAALVGAQPMISALERLRRTAEGPADLPESVKAFGIRGGGMLALFSSHPAIEDRIAALQTR